MQFNDDLIFLSLFVIYCDREDDDLNCSSFLSKLAELYNWRKKEKGKGKTDDVVERWSGIRIRSPLRLLRSGATYQGQIKSDPRT